MKKILVMFASIAMILSMTGCNRQIVDTTFSYNGEIIFPAEEIKKIDKVVRTFFSTFVYGGTK